MKKLHACLIGSLFLVMSIPAFASAIITGFTPPMPQEGWYVTNIKEVMFDKARDEDGNIISLVHDVVKVICYNAHDDLLMVQFDGADFPAGASLVNAIGKKLSVNIRKNPLHLYVEGFRVQ